jgi:glutamate formiminotransferase / formiminotetrahydrofolate cyclodeaminase
MRIAGRCPAAEPTMPEPLVECVPNFSEGRDQKKIAEIVQAMRDVPGVEVLHVDPGFETNRTVVTAAGAPQAIAEAAFRAIAKAGELIDMSRHSGAHPRQGSTDVCPFIPIAGVTMDECVAIAREVGRRVGEELGFPVYLYENAATRPERRSLAYVRQGEYEALPAKLAQPQWKPDFGPQRFDPKVGAITIGAREFLIAYNINLNTKSKDYATDIASELREKGRALRRGQTTPFYSSGALVKYAPARGVLPCGYCDQAPATIAALAKHYQDAHQKDLAEELRTFELDPAKLEGASVQRRGLFAQCRAVGWVIPEYGRAQISINLTNYKVTAAHTVLEATRALALDRGIVVTGSEIVGMVPYAALRESGEFYLARQRQSRGLPAKDVLDAAILSMGLRDVGTFDVQKQVLGLPQRSGALASMRVDELADEVSRPSPAPGGGSIAALAGSLGAALAAMVANLTHTKAAHAAAHDELESSARRAQEVKDALLLAVDADTQAFNEVLAANRLPKRTPDEVRAREQAIQEGMKKATSVPLRTAELCLAALRECLVAAQKGMPASVTDAAVGGLVAHAGLWGAVLNVRVNLGQIKDQDWVASIRAQLGALTTEGDALGAQIRGAADAVVA